MVNRRAMQDGTSARESIDVEQLEFLVLGSLEVRAGGRTLPLGGMQQRALLTLLILRANELVASDQLIDALWGDRPPPTATTAVQVYVSRLRKTLGAERIATRPPGYVLQLDRDELDLARFEWLVAQARATDDPRDTAVLLH